jgi:hypothetical protein
MNIPDDLVIGLLRSYEYYMSAAGSGSSPRDAFESWIDAIFEEVGMQQPCIVYEDAKGFLYFACGNSIYAETSLNDWDFCPFCGKPLELEV